jgi:hypothetical protein
MTRKVPIYIAVFTILAVTLACSLSSVQNSASSAKLTAQVLETDVSGVVSAGGGLIKTAQSLETEHPGILGTAKAVITEGAPFLGTVEAVATDNPGLVQTAQAVIQDEIPTGEPPTDIPLMDRTHAQDFVGFSQYIFFITPNQYQDVLSFYQTEMPNNGWQYLESESHVYANAAELVFTKDNRTATVNLSINPLNNTTAVVISLAMH